MEENFEIDTLFEAQTNHAMTLFFDHFLNRCKFENIEKLCLKMKIFWRYNKEVKIDLPNILKPLKLPEEQKEQAVNDFLNFLLIKQPIQMEFRNLSAPEIIKIKDLNRKFPEVQLDWLNLVNKQLLSRSKVTEDDEILIENPKLLGELLKAFAKLDKK